MNSKQRATLRSIASNIEPIFQVGKGSLSENQIAGIDEALEKRELVKITVLRSSDLEPVEIMEELCDALGATPVCTIGSKVVIYRRSKNEKIKHIESMAEEFAEMGSKQNLEFFCIGEQAICAVLAEMLTMENAPIDDVVRIREKQFVAMERMMKLAENDCVLQEQIQSTYKTNDIIAWQMNRLLSSPLPQFARLREDSKYIEMLNKWGDKN